MRALRSTIATAGVAIVVIGSTGCGKIAQKAVQEGVKSATNGSVVLNKNGVTVKDSKGNTCTQTVNNSGGKTVCVDSNGDTVANASENSNGVSGSIKDSNGSGSATFDSNGAVVSDSNGSVATGSHAKLPAGWPSAFPVPAGAKLTTSASTSSGMTVAFTSSGSADDLFNSIDSSAKSGGWTRTENITAGAGHQAMYTKGSQQASVSVGAVGSGATAVINISNS